MIEAIDHVEVVTRDMEESVKFYSEVIGFDVTERHKMDGTRGITEIVYMKLGDSVLELLEFKNAKPITDERPKVGMRMMALRVDNMEKEVERLKSLGVEISRPPMQLGTSWRGEIKDNNGMSIEIRQW